MYSDELLRAGVRRLLHGTPDRPEGLPGKRREVALVVGCSPDNLYQVAKPVYLPSGKPRSVGRTLNDLITEAIPDWLDGIAEYADEMNWATHEMAGPSMKASLGAIRSQLIGAPKDGKEKVSEALRLLALSPDSDGAFEEALSLLSALRK